MQTYKQNEGNRCNNNKSKASRVRHASEEKKLSFVDFTLIINYYVFFFLLFTRTQLPLVNKEEKDEE
jgi:hypothetical protein